MNSKSQQQAFDSVLTFAQQKLKDEAAKAMTTTTTRATEINKLHDAFCNGIRTSLEYAIKAGELLIAQKKECSHGNWLPWIEANLTFSVETAALYMRSFRNRSPLNLQHVTTLREANQLMAKPSQEEIDQRHTREKELKEKARALELEKQEDQIIEVDVDVKADPAFGSEAPEIESEEEFEDQVKRRVAEYEEEMRKERKEYILTDAEVAEVAKQFWDRAMKHLYQYDKLKVAKIYIKLLYKKYPQLMDEPL